MTVRYRPPLRDIGAERDIPAVAGAISGVRGFLVLFARVAIHFSRTFISYVSAFVARHTACAHHLVDELKSAGVEAEYLPVLNHIPVEEVPLPEEWSLLAYIGFHASSDTRDFYGWKTLCRLAEDSPDLRIDVVGRGADPKGLPPNLRFLGYVEDIRLVLRKVKGLLRINYHDGMPRMVFESLALGRYVICNMPIPAD
ncbi:MAG: glycosyltransferase family 4 protein [Deltaproteobacteria bacterium]|nr:glycosyltransferase family 4 protein [Deltaproteobacteria bacterium]